MIIKKVLAESGQTYPKRINELVDYITTPQNKDEETKCLKYEAFNFLSEQFATQKSEMRALIASYKSDVYVEKRDMIQHWIMSWNSQEMPHPDDVIKAAKHFLDELGLGEHQAFVGVHLDTENIHVHMAFSRVHPAENKLYKGSNEVIKSHAILAGIEHAMKAESNRNSLFVYNPFKGVVPNKNHKTSSKNGKRFSRSFAYASPEVVMVEIPKGMDIGKLTSMKKRKNLILMKRKKKH